MTDKYKRVPVEPTEAMRAACNTSAQMSDWPDTASATYMEGDWEEIIAAAPEITDADVERVARGLAIASGVHPDADITAVPVFYQKWLLLARAAIAALMAG